MGSLNIQQRLHEHSPEMRVCSGQDQYGDPEEKRMRKNTCRVIKIDKEALFEFIYENFIAQEEDMLDISDSVDVLTLAMPFSQLPFLGNINRTAG